jgi:O-antigen/teichoic acid export membrane protein
VENGKSINMGSTASFDPDFFTNQRRLISAGIWMTLARFGSAICGVLLVGLLSRLLSESEIAAYFLINNIVLIVSSLSQVGLNLIVVSFVGEQIALFRYYEARRTIEAIIEVVLICGSISTLIYITFGANIIGKIFSISYISDLSIPVGLWILIRTWQTLAAELFRSLNDIRLAALFGGLTSNFTGLAAVFLIHAIGIEISIEIVICMWMGIALMIGFLSAGLLKVKIPAQGVKRGESSVTIKKLLTASWPIWFTNIAVIAVTRLDLWIVGAFSSNFEIALYGGAAQLVLVMAMPVTIVNGVLSPIIPALKALEKRDKLENIVRDLTTLSAFFSVISAIVFWIFGDRILNFIYGNGFDAGKSILAILAFGQGFASLVGSAGYALVLCGFQRIVMKITFIASIISVGGGLILIKPFGIKGVALSFAIALSVQSALCAIESYRKIGIRVDASIGRVFSREIFKT